MEYGLVLVWLATYLALGALGVPLAALFFPRFADRGGGVALALSTAVLGVVAFWVGHLAFGWPALLAGLAVLFVGSALALRRGVDPGWRGYAGATVVFALAFLFMVGVRALDPAAWPGGGEKFLDFGMLASLMRTEVLPPEDPWFAGEAVQYYYGGHMIASLLARLTATPARYAYNLALPGFFGLLVATAYSLARVLAAERGVPRLQAGVAAALFVGLASNLATPLRLLYWLLPGTAKEWVGTVSGLDVEGLALGPGQFDYWLASRVIDGTINEFPFFAWVNGDMHGHMMTPQLLLLVVAVCFAYWQTPRRAVRRRRALVLGVVPLLAGLIAITSTWSFPIAGGLAWLTLAHAPGPPTDLLPAALARRLPAARSRLGGEVGRTAVALVLAGVVMGLGFLVAFPFLTRLTGGQGVGLLPDRSSAAGLVVVHGAFLAITVAYLAPRLDLSTRQWGAVAVGVAGLLAVTWPVTATAVALFVPVLVAAWLLVRAGRSVGFEGVLLVAVAGLVVLVEFAYVQEQAGPGRFNTVFKTYAQVWALWATAAGVMLVDRVDVPGMAADLAHDVRRAVGRPGGPGGTDDGRPAKTDGAGRRGGDRAGDGWRLPTRANLGALLAVGLLLSLSIYGGFTLASEVTRAREDPTLDARQYVAERHPGEAAAIEWLDDRPGQPNVASAPGVEIYFWVNGPSSLTGVPTVAGWAEEIGYRGRDVYEQRVRDVRILFEGDARSRAAILRKYDVRYVYVGPIERERYGNPDFGDEPGFRVAFTGGNVTIYEVNRTALGGG